MDFTYCTECGSSDIDEQDDYYECLECGARYTNDSDEPELIEEEDYD